MIPTESPVRRSGARDDPATAGELTQSRSRVGGETFSQEARSAQDPHSEGTLADIEVQVAALADIRDNIEAAGVLINRVEWGRRQLLDVRAVLDDRGDQAALVAAAGSMNQRLRGAGACPQPPTTLTRMYQRRPATP